MSEFKLIQNEDMCKEAFGHDKINHIKIYESDNYKLRILNYDSGYVAIDVYNNNDVPTLYIIQNEDNYKIEDIQIQTTSNGALNCDDIEKMINKYSKAVEATRKIKGILKENNLLMR